MTLRTSSAIFLAGYGLHSFCKLLISLSPFLAWFTLKGAENRAFNWIENPRVGGSNPPSGTISGVRN
jgi:hypothetical protein